MPRCSQPRHGSLYLYANERTPLEKELGVNDSSNDNSRGLFPHPPRVARRKDSNGPTSSRRADSFPHDRFVDATADAEAVIGFGFLLVILALTVIASSVFSAN